MESLPVLSMIVNPLNVFFLKKPDCILAFVDGTRQTCFLHLIIQRDKYKFVNHGSNEPGPPANYFYTIRFRYQVGGSLGG